MNWRYIMWAMQMYYVKRINVTEMKWNIKDYKSILEKNLMFFFNIIWNAALRPKWKGHLFELNKHGNDGKIIWRCKRTYILTWFSHSDCEQLQFLIANIYVYIISADFDLITYISFQWHWYVLRNTFALLT